jgi:hypothetical protein
MTTTRHNRVPDDPTAVRSDIYGGRASRRDAGDSHRFKVTRLKEATRDTGHRVGAFGRRKPVMLAGGGVAAAAAAGGSVLAWRRWGRRHRSRRFPIDLSAWRSAWPDRLQRS